MAEATIKMVKESIDAFVNSDSKLQISNEYMMILDNLLLLSR